jgi:hypothetical protein
LSETTWIVLSILSYLVIGRLLLFYLTFSTLDIKYWILTLVWPGYLVYAIVVSIRDPWEYPLKTDNRSIMVTPKFMVLGVYYKVTLDGSIYFYRRVSKNKIEIYEQTEDRFTLLSSCDCS